MTLTLPTPIYGEANNARGRVAIDPAIFQQPRTRIIVTTGQSMLGNFTDAPPTAFNPNAPAYELCIFDGLIRPCDGGPHMNMNGWPHLPADQYPQRISVLDEWGRALCGLGKNARTLICGLNIGGTPSWLWNPGTDLFNRAVTALRLLESLGLYPTEWVHVLGHGDRQDSEMNAVPAIETAARFAANTVRFIDGIRAAGYTGRMLIGRGAYQNGCTEAQRAAVVIGQKWAVETTDAEYGPNDDNLSAATYRAVADGCHWSETGRWANFYSVHPDPLWSWCNYFPTL